MSPPAVTTVTPPPPRSAHRIKIACPSSGPALPVHFLQGTPHPLPCVPLSTQTGSGHRLFFSMSQSPQPGAQKASAIITQTNKRKNSRLPQRGPGTGTEEAGRMGQPRRGGPPVSKGGMTGTEEGRSGLRGAESAKGVGDSKGGSLGARCDPREVLSLLLPPLCSQLGSCHNHPGPAQFPGALGSDNDNNDNEDKVQVNKTLLGPHGRLAKHIVATIANNHPPMSWRPCWWGWRASLTWPDTQWIMTLSGHEKCTQEGVRLPTVSTHLWAPYLRMVTAIPCLLRKPF